MDRAGQVATAVFSARGTLLGDALTLAAVEPMSKMEARTLLGRAEE